MARVLDLAGFTPSNAGSAPEIDDHLPGAAWASVAVQEWRSLSIRQSRPHVFLIKVTVPVVTLADISFRNAPVDRASDGTLATSTTRILQAAN
ncbi:hypothetical protein VPNG_05575 [Cytospora leucostoma]|uniref:Uncharacterized protein n=1 Tax=Cytospora leucostoma TaxID=1230097 RepID=A0A423X7I0_9PEZI|nr:hypothetical protein VPNG_05575 [Cytospora leucostoma]